MLGKITSRGWNSQAAARTLGFARRATATVLLLPATLLVSSAVEQIPSIGPSWGWDTGFISGQPLEPQLLILQVVSGGGGALTAALSILAWSDQGPCRPDMLRTTKVFAALIAIATLLYLARITFFGLYWPQGEPVLRWTALNSLISATAITALWASASAFLNGPRTTQMRGLLRALRNAAWWFAGSTLFLVAAAAAICVAGGVNIRVMLAYWLWGFPLYGGVIALAGSMIPQRSPQPASTPCAAASVD